MSYSRIVELVITGRITPAQGAILLEMRREIQRRRRPWWLRLIDWLTPEPPLPPEF